MLRHWGAGSGSSIQPNMCNLYSITTNQAAIAALFRIVNRYVGNLAPMPGVFPDYPAPVIRNSGGEFEIGNIHQLLTLPN
jgi:putative SOS response-associated peptidase YedK